MKRILLFFLLILSLGCMKSTEKDSRTAFNEKHKPLKELKLTSVLYELAVASEPETFAKEHGISLSNGRVRVFIYFDPASSDPERKKTVRTHNVKMEKESNDLSRVLVPINRLIPLSKEPVVQSIRLPIVPIK